TSYTPPSPVTVTAGLTTVTVKNTLDCKDKPAGNIDLAIAKTGATTPVQQPFYSFDITVTNVGDAITGAYVITVTDTVPPNMTFNSMSGPGWVCGPASGPAGTLFTCTFSGPVAAGQVLPAIHIDATATGSAPYPPVTNCADVSLPPTSGLI